MRGGALFKAVRCGACSPRTLRFERSRHCYLPYGAGG